MAYAEIVAGFSRQNIFGISFGENQSELWSLQALPRSMSAACMCNSLIYAAPSIKICKICVPFVNEKAKKAFATNWRTLVVLLHENPSKSFGSPYMKENQPIRSFAQSP
eukprot:6822-Heterococcus_DN1.PRE.2